MEPCCCHVLVKETHCAEQSQALTDGGSCCSHLSWASMTRSFTLVCMTDTALWPMSVHKRRKSM